MLALGIPEYRLPRDLIRAEIEVIRQLGVEIICNTKVGEDIDFDDIDMVLPFGFSISACETP